MHDPRETYTCDKNEYKEMTELLSLEVPVGCGADTREGGLVPPAEAGAVSETRQDQDPKSLRSSINNRPIKIGSFHIDLTPQKATERMTQTSSGLFDFRGRDPRSIMPLVSVPCVLSGLTPTGSHSSGRKREMFCLRETAHGGEGSLSSLGPGGFGCHPSICT